MKMLSPAASSAVRTFIKGLNGTVWGSEEQSVELRKDETKIKR